MSETNGAVPTCGFTGHKFSYCDCEVPIPMTTPNLHAKVLAKIEENHNAGNFGVPRDSSPYYPAALQNYNALKGVVEIIKPYYEHDIKNVTMVDGVYNKEQAEAWEKVHGHDIRLNCYPEFGCQLLIDPEDLLLTLIEQLGMSDE